VEAEAYVRFGVQLEEDLIVARAPKLLLKSSYI
jgi:hypothetical protein